MNWTDALAYDRVGCQATLRRADWARARQAACYSAKAAFSLNSQHSYTAEIASRSAFLPGDR